MNALLTICACTTSLILSAYQPGPCVGAAISRQGIPQLKAALGKSAQTPLGQPAKTVWRDRGNGRRYALPGAIGGRPASFYLNNPRVSPLAKALYTARFRPTDNDSTTQLLALVTTNDQTIRPFYRWCLDFTITVSDGALGEYPGAPALAYATKFPQEFFAYMDKDASGQRYKKWVVIIAYSGLNYNQTGLKNQQIIINGMTKHCVACGTAITKKITAFSKDVVASANGNDLFQK